MARPKKNNAEYFTHDKDMRNDPRIRAVRNRFGLEGYSIYNMILEVLTDADYFIISWDEDNIEIMAGDFMIDPIRLSEIVNHMIKIGLFEHDGEKLWNDKLITRFQPLITKRERDLSRFSPAKNTVESKFSPAKNTVESKFSPAKNTVESKFSPAKNTQSKVKESKVKESKVEVKEVLTPDKPKTRKQPDALQFPFASAEFKKAWSDLLSLAKWKKKPLSALQISLNQLSRYDEKYAIGLIEKAHGGNYQGVVFDDTEEKYQRWLKMNQSNMGKIQISSPVKNYEGWD